MAKAKRGILDGYKTYDPRKEGYGSIDDWGAAFNARMNVEEAAAAMGSDNPYVILGWLGTKLPTMDELKKIYRKLMLANQEKMRADSSEADQSFIKSIIAAYTILEDRIRRTK
jgi:hypothetical protein